MTPKQRTGAERPAGEVVPVAVRDHRFDCFLVAKMMEQVRSLPGTWEVGEMIRVRNKRVAGISVVNILGCFMSMVVP